MYHNRLIPCLLLRDQGLIKTVQFQGGRYLGDPINAVKIYNDREVDELFIIDIDATAGRRKPDFEYLKKVTQQCFMPVGYAGGVSSVGDMKLLYEIGFEKVAIGAEAYRNPRLLNEASDIFGSQSIVGVMDVRNGSIDSGVYLENGKKKVSSNPVDFAIELEKNGVGEILVNSIERDGMMKGYDIDLISKIATAVKVPIVACGGAGSLKDCADAVKAGASAVAAGSLFVYWGRKRAILINYPDVEAIEKAFR